MKNIKLENACLVTERGLLKSDVVLQGDRIDLSGKKITCDETMNLSGKYILPGFVDIHFHGYGLFDFTFGKFNPKTDSFDNSQSAYQTGFDMLSNTLAGFGVTGFYLASVSATVDELRNCYSHLADFLKEKTTPSKGARLLGGMLEGTFINADMAGAQNPEHLFEPSSKVFDQIKDADSIKLANVVPDFGDKSIKLIEYLTSKGIVVAAGHTDATCDQFEEAVKAGLKYCIHFTNGPTGGSYKPFNGGGAIEAVLKFDRIYAELIADGFHVNPAYIRDIIKRKGIEKILGITDCMFVAGSSLKQINYGGIKGQVDNDSGFINVADKQNTLFGSNLTMLQAFENMLNWLTSDIDGIWNRKHLALDFEDALTAATKMYSTNPCRLTGLKDKGFGKIANGAKADLCVLDITGSQGNYKVTVQATIVDGNVVYSRK